MYWNTTTFCTLCIKRDWESFASSLRCGIKGERDRGKNKLMKKNMHGPILVTFFFITLYAAREGKEREKSKALWAHRVDLIKNSILLLLMQQHQQRLLWCTLCARVIQFIEHTQFRTNKHKHNHTHIHTYSAEEHVQRTHHERLQYRVQYTMFVNALAIYWTNRIELLA